jgi:hypothetical protein
VVYKPFTSTDLKRHRRVATTRFNTDVVGRAGGGAATHYSELRLDRSACRQREWVRERDDRTCPTPTVTSMRRSRV